MDTRTGELISQDDLALMKSIGDFVTVDDKDMTKKQRKEMKVSLKDHRSKLGKKLTYERKARKIGRNEPCPCGSGLKYKKCCLVFKNQLH